MSIKKEKYVIALTGGIATGKTRVSEDLAGLGASIVDTDIIARQVVEPGMPALERIREEWGPDVLNPDGTLNRKALGNMVFSNQGELKKLNGILHPPIREKMNTDIAMAPARVVVLVIPLLYETGRNTTKFDEDWLVYCSREMQLQRLMKRDRLSREDAEKRIDSQLPIEDKKNLARVVIDSSGPRKDTIRQVQTQWSLLMERLR